CSVEKPKVAVLAKRARGGGLAQSVSQRQGDRVIELPPLLAQRIDRKTARRYVLRLSAKGHRRQRHAGQHRSERGQHCSRENQLPPPLNRRIFFESPSGGRVRANMPPCRRRCQNPGGKPVLFASSAAGKFYSRCGSWLKV